MQAQPGMQEKLTPVRVTESKASMYPDLSKQPSVPADEPMPPSSDDEVEMGNEPPPYEMVVL